jgi:hypothetical protein
MLFGTCASSRAKITSLPLVLQVTLSSLDGKPYPEATYSTVENMNIKQNTF